MKRGTIRHPKLLHLARVLAIEPYCALGLLEALLDWTFDYARAGNVGKFSDGDIAQAIGWQGDPAMLIAALVDTRWLDRCDVHRLVVHDIADHVPKTWKELMARQHVDFAVAQSTSRPPVDYQWSTSRPPVDEQSPPSASASASAPSSSPDVLPGIIQPSEARMGGGAGGTKQRADKRRSLSPWPDDFTLTDKRRVVAEACELDAAWEWGKFRDHARAHDKRYANWDAAWRNWCRQAPDFAGRGNHAAR